jgi:hypothetical protein
MAASRLTEDIFPPGLHFENLLQRILEIAERAEAGSEIDY